MHFVFADIVPNRQLREDENYYNNNRPAPADTRQSAETKVASVGCSNIVCKERLQSALSEVRKANYAARSLVSAMEDKRISASRHILHLKALKKYQIDNGKNALTSADIEMLFEEGLVLENPDVEMGDTNREQTNRSLTSQSLSHHGFTDSESGSEYLPGGDN